MKKIVYLVLVLFSMASCKENPQKKSDTNENAEKVEYIFDGGEVKLPVVVNNPPQRAALFSPSATEILLALGLEDRMVVGTMEGDVLPQYKEAYDKVPQKFIGHSFKMTKEAFLLTEPDFISGYPTDVRDDTTGSPEELIKNNIYPFNLSSMIMADATLDNVFEDIKMLGKIFAVEDRADKLISEMKEKLKNAELKKPENGEKTKTMIMASIANGIWIYGSLATDLINKAHGKNIYDDVPGQYELVSYESILERNPDVIFMADIVSRGVSIDEKIRILKTDPILRDVSAVKNNRIYKINNEDIVPSVRNVDFIIKMNKIFYGNDK